MKEFTNDEKIIAKNINERYKWMARGSSGNLFVYAAKPLKMKSSWDAPMNIFNSFGEPEKFFLFNHLFHAIKWEDDEPTRIRDIYNPPILNDAEQKYLKTVLEPFHDEVDYVVKYEDSFIDGGTYRKEHLIIELYDGTFKFPGFDLGKMYSGMKLDKKYSLDELGIKYASAPEHKRGKEQ